jgi:glycosyltransferase involved in cell wall biosynthesis
MKISAVIPTRNRESHIRSLLANLRRQTYALSEVIIIDSSDDKAYRQHILSEFYSLPLIWIDSEASVCIQRNKGIRAASSPWIFLCDDDIQIPDDYIEQLVSFIKDQGCSSVTGLFMQRENDEWVYSYPFKNFTSLLWAYIFKLSVWGSVDNLNVNYVLRPLYKYLCKYYKRRGNTMSDAGWPIITQLDKPYFTTSTYSLGSNLIKKEWLENSPYEEVLDSNGYGDNYGVALGFPKKQNMYVTHQTRAYNGKATENRLDTSIAYFRRVLALHYFLDTKKQFTVKNRMWFIWSLIGNQILFLFKKRSTMTKANFEAIRLILTNKNPYLLAVRNGGRIIKPTF